MSDYCPYDCKDGWIETDSYLGTTCPIHPPAQPEPIREVIEKVEP